MPQITPEDQSPRSIRAAAERIRALCAGLDQAAAVMETKGIASVRVQNHAALMRVLQDLNRWAKSVETALTEELMARGEFQAGGEPKKPRRKR